MKRMVFGESVQGASHKRVDKECQDSFKKLEYDDGTVIMAIADGHGSKACPYSKSGSSIAVNVFCKVMDEFHASYAENLEMLLTSLRGWYHILIPPTAQRKQINIFPQSEILTDYPV